MANKFITIDEASRNLLEAFDQACDKANATPEERAAAFVSIAAWLGGFPMTQELATKVDHG